MLFRSNWQDYVAWRLEDQFNYYRKKTVRLHQEQTRLQWLITIAGGLGTLLAAINQQIWVAVSSAVSAALISRLEFQQIETTLVGCNQAANDLYSIRAWWRALPVGEQENPQNLEQLVKLTENVIQSENAGWVQEMRDALSDMYGETEAESEEASDSDGEEEETEAEGQPSPALPESSSSTPAKPVEKPSEAARHLQSPVAEPTSAPSS